MPDLLFDGRKIAVPEGTNLVEAGLAAGVPVPVFCYHKDLGPVGACRVCAVTAARGGKSRMVMACMTAAEEGMEVTTLDPASVAFRKRVLEWLMVQHPHDCPICDEGGECQLQDLTIAAGHAQRRYRGRKRTFPNQYLGEFIVHEMNRCIACYRCSRFYQEVAGGRDFGVSGSRDRVYFGRFEDGPLESPFSGNLVELCPTGVFTDKLFRYRSRVWDLDQSPSVCPHCSVGCNVLPGARYREVQRVRVRENRAVNGVFLCDRGQFGHRWSVDPGRPRHPRVAGETLAWESALGAIGAQLLAIAGAHGGSSIALIASPRAALETHEALRGLATGPLEGARVAHFDDPEREPRSLAALGALAAAGAAPLDASDLLRCDVLLVAGASLVDEAPVMALMARQMVRAGGRLFTLGPLERDLLEVAEEHVPVHPAGLAEALRAIAGSSAGGAAAGAPEGAFGRIGAALAAAARPGVLLGHDLMDGPAFVAGAALAQALRHRTQEARFGCLFSGPDGFGAAALTARAALAGILADIERGAIRAAVIVESDLEDLGAGVVEALARLELLVIADHVGHELGARAHAVLPTTTPYESDGCFVNRAGRIQAFAAAAVPGLPVTQLIERETFPRQPRSEPPGGEARPAWWVMEQLRPWTGGAPRPRGLEGVRQALAGRPAFANLPAARPGDAGLPVAMSGLGRDPELSAFAAAGRGLQLFRLDRTLGSEPLSRRSTAMERMAGPPRARVSPEALPGTRNGPAKITLQTREGALEVEAVADPSVPPGVVLLPRDARWPSSPSQGAAVELTAAQAAGSPR